VFAVIHIPDFSLQSLLRADPRLHTRAVVLLDDSGTKGRISQMTPAARAAGVTEGMSPTQAMARSAGLVVKARSLILEKTAGEIMLQCAYAVSPSIEATAPGVCTLDLDRLKSPIDEAFGRVILELLTPFDLRAQIGIADTPDLAFQAARSASPIRMVHERQQFLASVPLESLEPPAAMLGVLRNWGLRTLGDFIRLGREPIAERLGAEGLEWFERASARSIRPLRLILPPESYEEAIEFEHEIESLEPLLFLVRRFLDQICRRLELSGSVVEQINLRLDLASGDSYQQPFRIPSPTGQADILFRVVHTHLENLTLAHPIVALWINAKPCHPKHHQFGLFETSLRDPNHFYETVARLNALLGPGRVGTPVARETHQPDAFDMEAVRFSDAPTKAEAEKRLPPAGLILRRLRPAVPVLVELRNQRPVLLAVAPHAIPDAQASLIPAGEAERRHVRSPSSTVALLRRIGLRPHGSTRIETAQGPWRSSGNWWDKQRWERDEWDVQTQDGLLYRLSRQNSNWFVEGVYD
jgi:protein ImuB